MHKVALCITHEVLFFFKLDLSFLPVALKHVCFLLPVLLLIGPQLTKTPIML